MSINTPAPAGPLPADPPYRRPGPGHRARPGAAATVGPPDRRRPAAALTVAARAMRRGPAWTPSAPGCGCAPCTSWATARPASPAPWTSARPPSRTSSAATPAPSAPSCATRITDLYDAWWDKRAPARTRSERAAATAARRRAIAGNWCAAAALDDDQLDTPGYRPRWGWKPATGTGTAPDINPPALQQKRSTWRTPDWDSTEVLDVMERHGYRRSDQHAGQAIGLIRDVARIYEAPWTLPRGYVVVPSSQPTAPGRPADRRRLGRRGQDPAGRAGRSRRIQAGPGRDVRRLRRPVLHHLPWRLQAADASTSWPAR